MGYRFNLGVLVGAVLARTGGKIRANKPSDTVRFTLENSRLTYQAPRFSRELAAMSLCPAGPHTHSIAEVCELIGCDSQDW